MKRQKIRIAMAAAGCILLLCPVCVYGEVNPVLPEAGWSYESQENVWQYFSRDGQAVKGRQQIDGSIYFFDGEGRMLTGWVSSGDSIGDDAEVYRSGTMDDTVYYCDTTGRMCREQWMPAYAPDSPYFQVFSGPTEDGNEEVNWYYFDRQGNVV